MLDPQQSQRPMQPRLPVAVPDTAAQRCALIAQISRDTSALKEHRLSALLRLAETFMSPSTSGEPVAPCVLTALAYSLAKLCGSTTSKPSTEDRVRTVRDGLSKEINARATQFSPQQLVHLGSFLRAMKVCDPDCVRAIARVSERAMWDLSTEKILDHLINLHHLGLNNTDFFHDAGLALVSRIGSMQPGDVYRLVGILLVKRIRDKGIFEAFADTVTSGIDEMDFPAIVTTLRICARGGYRNKSFFSKLANRALEVDAETHRKPLIESIRLFGDLEVDHARPFFAKVAPRLQDFVPMLSASQLASLVYAYAKMGEFHMPLVRDISRALTQVVPKLSGEEISKVAWSYANLSVRDDMLLKELRNAIVARIDEVPVMEIPTIAWSFSTHRWRDIELFGTFSSVVQSRLPSIDSRKLSTLAWAFANVGIEDRKLSEAIAAAILSRKTYEPMINARLAWAFASTFPDLAASLCSVDDLDRVKAPREWHQLYQALLLTGQLPAHHAPARLRSLKQMDGPGRSGSFESDVVQALIEECGVSRRDIISQRHVAGIQTDIIIPTASKAVIIECDGDAFHRTAGPDGGTPIGRDIIQDRIFEKCGYDVLHVLSSEFYGAKRSEVISQIRNILRKQEEAAALPRRDRRIVP